MAHAGARAEVAGISISHPDRVLFPDAHATKLGLAQYYESIADWVLPHLVDRPLTLVRCPTGVPASGARKGVDCIFMKHAKAWGPAPIRRERIREKTKTGEYLIVDTLPALIGLVQMDVLEVHTWNSRCAGLEQPDRIVVARAFADIAPLRAVRTAKSGLPPLDLSQNRCDSDQNRGKSDVYPDIIAIHTFCSRIADEPSALQL